MDTECAKDALSARTACMRGAVIALFTAYCLYPAAIAFGKLLGVAVSLRSYPVWAGVLSALSAFSVAVSSKIRQKPEGAIRVLACFLPLLGFLKLILYFSGFEGSEPPVIMLRFILLFLSIGLSVYTRIKLLYDGKVKAWSYVLPFIAALPLGFLCFLGSIFGSIGEDTVITNAVSPDGRFCAELIDSDEGALGGSTLVTVRRNVKGHSLLFRWEGEPSVIYNGEWGEFNEMTIEWKDNDTLLIDGKEYRR